MKSAVRRKRILYIAGLLLLFLISAAFGLMIQNRHIEERRAQAGSVLELHKENIILNMKEQLNLASGLAVMKPEAMADSEWFHWKAEELLKQQGVRSILVFDGDRITMAFPERIREFMTGRDLKELSYLYTMAKVVKEQVVDGPVIMEGTGEPVFLFLHPILEGREYRGEIALALSEEYVIERMNLERLSRLGYEYHLWKINIQDGSKDVVAVSNPDLDYSYAAKTEFYLPTQWNLSIIPTEGWISPKERLAAAAGIFLLWLILSALFLVSLALAGRYRKDRSAGFTDWQTGLLNRRGLGRELNRWIQEGEETFTVFYFAIEEFTRIIMLAGEEKEAECLRSIPAMLEDYIESSYAAARITGEGFAVAVRERLTEDERADFARGLSMKMIWKFRLHGRKVFLNTKYQYVSYPEDGEDLGQLLQTLIEKYYTKPEEREN